MFVKSHAYSDEDEPHVNQSIDQLLNKSDKNNDLDKWNSFTYSFYSIILVSIVYMEWSVLKVHALKGGQNVGMYDSV